MIDMKKLNEWENLLSSSGEHGYHYVNYAQMGFADAKFIVVAHSEIVPRLIEALKKAIHQRDKAIIDHCTDYNGPHANKDNWEKVAKIRDNANKAIELILEGNDE